MLALIATLFDIIRLRKGPDAIPYSWLVLLLAVVLWLIAGLVMMVTTDGVGERDLIISVFTGLAGLGCYMGVVVLTGNTPRLTQTVTAILGCGAVLSLLSAAGDIVLSPWLGKNVVNLIVTLILLWSIPVEGHIIARAINRHWYVGIVVAIAVFVIQIFLYAWVGPAADAMT